MGWLFETIQTGLELTEAADGSFKVKGLFGICGVPTANGRIYPKRLVEREIKRLGERMANSQVAMELDHPQEGKPSLERVAGLLTSLRLDGDNVIGEARILNTPKGQIIRELVKGGMKIGVSSRGFGSTKTTSEGDEVGEDFALATYDFVADPSVRSALPKFYMESTEAPTDETPVEMFQREFPEAYGQLTEAAARDAVTRAQEQTAAIIERAVEAERTRVRGEMTEAFERQLRDTVVGLREDLERELREEYAQDPAVGGAKAVLAQIVEMVGAYRQAPDAVAVQDALKAAELAAATAATAAEQAEARAVRSERLLVLEAKLAGHPLAAPLRTLLTPVVVVEGVEALDARVEDLLAEAQHMVPESAIEEQVSERVALTEETKKRSQLAEQVDKLKAKLVEAVKLGQEADRQRAAAEARAEAAEEALEEGAEDDAEAVLDAYKRGAMASLPEGARARRLIEAASDEATVGRMIAESRAAAMADGDLEQARRAVRGRGAAPGATAFASLEEGAAPRGAARGTDTVVDSSELTAGDMAALCGVGL